MEMRIQYSNRNTNKGGKQIKRFNWLLVCLVVSCLVTLTLAGCVSKSEYEALQADYTALAAEKESIEANYDKLNTEHEALQADYTALAAEKESIEADYDKLNTEHEALQAEKTTLITENKSLKADLDKAKAELVTAQAESEATQAKVQEYESRLAESRLVEAHTYAEVYDVQVDQYRLELALPTKYGWVGPGKSPDWMLTYWSKVSATGDTELNEMVLRAFALPWGGEKTMAWAEFYLRFAERLLATTKP